MTEPIQVLYVEDEADIREMTEFALEDEGFELVLCGAGQEALEKAPSLTPDLILLDVMMPGMDGPSVLKMLRQQPHLINTPAIFMTAKVQPSEIKQLLSYGAVGVIAKPFDPMTLGGKIRELIG